MGKAVDRIIEDIRDRRGLKSEWNGIDEDVKAEIRETWSDIIAEEAIDDRALRRLVKLAYHEGHLDGREFDLDASDWRESEIRKVMLKQVVDHQHGLPTALQVSHMEHALGMNSYPRVSRNYFCASPDTDDDLEWWVLEHMGLARMVQGPSPMLPYNIYVVTDSGKARVGLGEPAEEEDE